MLATIEGFHFEHVLAQTIGVVCPSFFVEAVCRRDTGVQHHEHVEESSRIVSCPPVTLPEIEGL